MVSRIIDSESIGPPRIRYMMRIERHHQPGVEPLLGDERGGDLRQLAQREEVVERRGTEDDHEDHARAGRHLYHRRDGRPARSACG